MQSSDKDVAISLLCKQHEGKTYLFTVAMRDKPLTGAVHIGGLNGKSSIEVIGESRAIEATDGHFTDHFEGYGVHLYRLTAR